MSQKQHLSPSNNDNKKQRTSPTTHSSAVHPSTARLQQLPTDPFNLVYVYLPWYDRLLHVSHVHRQLPPAWLEWTEYDHVRLTEALLIATTQLHPSAVQCCRHVQSLCVERVRNNELATVSNRWVEGDDVREMDAEDYYEARQQPQPATRMEWIVQNMQLSQVISSAQTGYTPFGNVRSLVSSYLVFHRLLEWSQLPHLHSLSLYWTGSLETDIADEEYNSQLINEYLRGRPTLRRIRLERVTVPYAAVCALPAVEYVDIRHAVDAGVGRLSSAPTSPSLRQLLLPHLNPLVQTRGQVHGLLTSLQSNTLQHLSIRAQLTNEDLLTLTTLHSLTALELQRCFFDDTNALGRLVSDKAEPLLPNLQRFAIGGSDADEIDYDDMRTSTAAFLQAYSRQLRHIKLSVRTDPANSLAAVLSVIVFSMPQLESLTLEVESDLFEMCEVVDDIVPPAGAQMQLTGQPTLPALHSLILRNLPMSDPALEQLLACCPNLLELTIDRVAPLTAAFWQSLLHCPRLLSFSYALSGIAAEAAFPQPLSSSSSSSSPAPASNFPYLKHVRLAFGHAGLIHPRGFAQLLSMFDGSRITSLALSLPDEVDHGSYVRQLASLPHLTALLLDMDEGVEDDQFEVEHEYTGGDVVGLLEEHSEPLRWSSEQYHINMTYYWRHGLLGEEEDELRVKHAAGLKAPFFAPSGALRERSNDIGESGYRVFNRATGEGQEDGRVNFFRALETERAQGVSSGT